MKRFLLKHGKMVAALALVLTSMAVNSACPFATYQPPVPQKAKELRKF